MRKWSLGQLTVIGTRPWELVEIAARAGYDAVDPLVGLAEFPGLPVVPLKKGDADTVKFAEALKANGIAFNVADAFLINEQTDREAMHRMVDLCGELGAKTVNAILFDEDRGRGLANLVALDAMAAAAGMKVIIEFLALSQLATGRQALDLIAETGSDNIGLMVDALHLSYTGGTPADMGGFGNAIMGAQLCDAPLNLSFEEYYRVAIEERLVPGEGDLPMAAFMAALPAGLTCAIEVPRPTEPDLVARAKRSLEAGKAVDRAGQAA